MPHETGLIMTIVAGLVLAFIFGIVANRLRLPPLVGYLVAGILVGPHTPGFVADTGLAGQLAEIGVILLMFGVGLHFSLKDLLSVRAIAIPGALVQIAFATLLGLGLAMLLGWGVGGGLVFGLALSVASTVVLLKALQERRLVETERGRIAVGWLIVEDLAMVIALVLIPALASIFGATTAVPNDPFVSLVERLIGGDVGLWGVLGITLVKLAAFVGVMLIVGRRVIPFILHYTAHTGNRELFRLAVLAIALGVAAGAAYLFGVSLALGAFFAGMILSESELSHRAAQETLPLRDAFAVLFFVSVGMLFDPTIIVTNPWPLLATVFIIVIGKSVAAFLIVIAFRKPISTALIISASLAQIGEFSFILAALGVSLNLLPPEGRDLILGGAIISIILNPIVFLVVDFLKPWIESRSARHDTLIVEPGPAVDGPALDTVVASAESQVHDANDPAPEPTRLHHHTILIGYGRVGRVVAEGLIAARAPFLVIEDADSRVANARSAGIEVVIGNAASNAVLNLANIATANSLLIAIPNSFEAGNAVEHARKLNPGIRIFARAHSEDEEEHLRHLGADTVIMGEREIGLGMLGLLLRQGAPPAAAAEAPAEPLTPLHQTSLHRADPIVAAPLAAVAASAVPEVDIVTAAILAEELAADELDTELDGIGLGFGPDTDTMVTPAPAIEPAVGVAKTAFPLPADISAAPVAESSIAAPATGATTAPVLALSAVAPVNMTFLDAWDETPDEAASPIPDVLPPVGPLSNSTYAPSSAADEPEPELAGIPQPPPPDAADTAVEPSPVEAESFEPEIVEEAVADLSVTEPLPADPTYEQPWTAEPAIDAPVFEKFSNDETPAAAASPAVGATPVDTLTPEVDETLQSGANLPASPEPETAALPAPPEPDVPAEDR